MIEFAHMTARFICNRGVTHELVRHRLVSFAQESTRYCNYGRGKFGQGITVVRPQEFLQESSDRNYIIWVSAMGACEDAYLQLIHNGVAPQIARGVLPIDLKTEIVVCANFREWMHIFSLRTSDAAHPHIRCLMIDLQDQMNGRYPEVFCKGE